MQQLSVCAVDTWGDEGNLALLADVFDFHVSVWPVEMSLPVLSLQQDHVLHFGDPQPQSQTRLDVLHWTRNSHGLHFDGLLRNPGSLRTDTGSQVSAELPSDNREASCGADVNEFNAASRGDTSTSRLFEIQEPPARRRGSEKPLRFSSRGTDLQDRLKLDAGKLLATFAKHHRDDVGARRSCLRFSNSMSMFV